ncbi:tetratricopeptide repeat protein [Pontibacter sp. SGAir0037]|uniref:tetratricopeptide repeat protein n=1 Tax=Pontibacter sp. SGAir0037 TaxID=2571030 RepID=UPI0010CD6588|nr:tetratricopeptide repeat protein [Pontibacter sp. SGAir0037]QCR21567.1 hypothetical protein C1N53_03860 [Pontibacter sp. SGAir0037]
MSSVYNKTVLIVGLVALGLSLALFLPSIYLDVAGQAQKHLYLYQGKLAYGNGEVGDAEVLYRKAWKHSAGEGVAAFNLANALYRQERFSEAASFYRVAIRQSPATYAAAESWFNLGNALFGAGDTLQSIQAFQQGMLLDSEDQSIRQNLLFVLDQYEKGKANKKAESAEQQQDRKQDKPEAKRGPEPEEKGSSADEKSDQAFKVSEKEMQDLFDLLNQNEEAVRGRIGKQKQKHQAVTTNEPDY